VSARLIRSEEGRATNFDPDEVQGIMPEDLVNASSFYRRLFRLHQRGGGKITFGTGGWRAIIRKVSPYKNLRRLSQVQNVYRQGGQNGVVLDDHVSQTGLKFLPKYLLATTSSYFIGGCMTPLIAAAL
jgi:hypothetical protein